MSCCVCCLAGLPTCLRQKTPDLVPQKPDSSLETYTHKHARRGVTRLDASRGKKQVWRPRVRTWGLSKANALYWIKYFRLCWDFSAPPYSHSTPRKCFPLPPHRFPPGCITKYKIDNKTRQKHRYNTIPIFRSIFFPRCYTVAHLCFIKYTENCQGNSKIFAIFFAPCMVIDSRQKWLVMNMQLRKCFPRAKLFLLKKARFCLAFFDFQKGQNFNIWLQISQTGNTAVLYHCSRNLLCRMEVATPELQPFVKSQSVTYGGNALSSDGYYHCFALQI